MCYDHWDKYLLDIFEKYADTLEPLFNGGNQQTETNEPDQIEAPADAADNAAAVNNNVQVQPPANSETTASQTEQQAMTIPANIPTDLQKPDDNGTPPDGNMGGGFDGSGMMGTPPRFPVI